MKRLIVAFAILLGLLACLLAQEGPTSVGSDTVARPRKPAADTSAPATTPNAAPEAFARPLLRLPRIFRRFPRS